ncbi:unnamed protein product [Moneuplotes crassus]|uniref:Uncharacterized protein n=1 Tax=Euplotes crassus TaxID=5936 RepID=A0AAD1U355_EUPCR|nr:unnamed protein product [Moneuplotes crassus]
MNSLNNCEQLRPKMNFQTNPSFCKLESSLSRINCRKKSTSKNREASSKHKSKERQLKGKENLKSESPLKLKLKMLDTYGINIPKRLRKEHISPKILMDTLQRTKKPSKTKYFPRMRTYKEPKTSKNSDKDISRIPLGNYKKRLNKAYKAYYTGSKNSEQSVPKFLTNKDVSPISPVICTTASNSINREETTAINYSGRRKSCSLMSSKIQHEKSMNETKKASLQINSLKSKPLMKHSRTNILPKMVINNSDFLRNPQTDREKSLNKASHKDYMNERSVISESSKTICANENEDEINSVTTNTYYKLKLSSKLPQMTVEDEKQADILKFIFTKNFSKGSHQMSKAATLPGYYKKLQKEQEKHKQWEMQQRKEQRKNMSKQSSEGKLLTLRRANSIQSTVRPRQIKKSMTIFEKVFNRNQI